MDKAIRLAQKQMFTSSNGGRSSVPKLLIFLTDGLQTAKFDYEDPSLIADELRTSGVEVQVVSMGRNIDITDLIKIAGKESNLFKAETFDVLSDEAFLQRIVLGTCKQGNLNEFIKILYMCLYIFMHQVSLNFEIVPHNST